MREVISVHVGQAGLQIGNACCEYEFPLLVSAYLSSRFHRRLTRRLTVYHHIFDNLWVVRC